jgi:hypothetical protein
MRITFLAGLTVIATVSLARSATVLGTVSDLEAHPVPVVQISVEDASGKTLASAPTDEQGHYKISGLPPGIYDYVLGAPSTALSGGSATAYLSVDGLTIDWTLSMRPAVAVANQGAGTWTVDGNPWGLSGKDFGALIAGGTLAVGDGLIGRCAAGACFSGTSSGPSM